jgi:hypothetical protein
MTDDELRELILSQLRGESLRAKLYDADVHAVGIALKGCAITNAEALKWMREIGVPDGVLKRTDEIMNGGGVK